MNRPTTLELIENVEKHDDVYHPWDRCGQAGAAAMSTALATIISRATPNIFYLYLDTWPKVEARPDWNFALKDSLMFDITVKFKFWEHHGVFDFNSYREQDRSIFCAAIEKFVEEVSKKLLAEAASGKPWWKEHKSEHSVRWAFNAQDRHGTRLYDWIEHLGEIKKRGGKWVWHMMPGKHLDEWNLTEHKQGACKTLEEAKAIIEKGWIAKS